MYKVFGLQIFKYFINVPKSIALQIFGSIGSDPSSFNPFFSHSSFTLPICDGLNIGDVTSHFGQENPAMFSITPMIGNPTIWQNLICL